MNLNKVFLIGRLTQDPESRSTPSGQTVTTIRMATNRVWNDQSGQKKEVAEYHTVIAWARLGEIAAKYLKKGGMIMIEGRMQTRNWTGQDNVKRYTTEIIAENLQMGPRTDGGGSSNYSRPINNGMSDVRRAMPTAAPAEEHIPVINADEPTISNAGSNFEEDEMK